MLEQQSRKFTHADYMDNKCSHHEYFIQFATPENTKIVMDTLAKNGYGIEKLKEYFAKDEHLNNTISMKKYNAMAGHQFNISGGFEKIFIFDRDLFFKVFATEYNSSADKVCLAKAIIKREVSK